MDSNLYRLFVRHSPASYVRQSRILESEMRIHAERGEVAEARLKMRASLYCLALAFETEAWLRLLPQYCKNDPLLS